MKSSNILIVFQALENKIPVNIDGCYIAEIGGILCNIRVKIDGYYKAYEESLQRFLRLVEQLDPAYIEELKELIPLAKVELLKKNAQELKGFFFEVD